jgi:PUB domain
MCVSSSLIFSFVTITQSCYEAWVFEDAETSEVYLYYIPYRVIPTLPTASTISPEDNDTGMHKFSFIPSKADDPYLIGVSDSIMPHPAISHFREPLHGITWTLTHMSRTIVPEDPSIQTLQKFLTNIINHPETVKYRQLRIASQQVKPIWDSPMRGLLLSVGFVEVEGYAELGCHAEPLSPSRVQEVALLSHLLREWVSRDSAFSVNQPLGALDGFGRHGFGRAGTMS